MWGQGALILGSGVSSPPWPGVCSQPCSDVRSRAHTPPAPWTPSTAALASGLRTAALIHRNHFLFSSAIQSTVLLEEKKGTFLGTPTHRPHPSIASSIFPSAPPASLPSPAPLWGPRGWGLRQAGDGRSLVDSTPTPWPVWPPAQGQKWRDTSPKDAGRKECTTQPAQCLPPNTRAGGQEAQDSRGVTGSTPGKQCLGRRNLQTSVYQNEAL